MTDINGIEITDVIGLKEPMLKFVETVSCGIGKLYEPIHTMRMAKAKAEEIDIISNAINRHSELPVFYSDGVVTVNATDANELVLRTQNRMLYQELRKQQNIEAIIEAGLNVIKDKETVTKEPVDLDWVNSFFDFIANVSDSDMQILWGKLLAGEVERPGSFSIRTLDVLRKLTKQEAMLFQKFVPYIFVSPTDIEGFLDYFILDSGFIETYGLRAPEIMLLCEAGLMAENHAITLGITIRSETTESIIGYKTRIDFTNHNDEDVLLGHTVIFLTEAGKQLYNLLVSEDFIRPSRKYFVETFDMFLHEDDKSYMNDLEITDNIEIKIVSL